MSKPLEEPTKEQKTDSTKTINKNAVLHNSHSIILNKDVGISKSQQLTSKLQKRKRPAQALTKNKTVKICGNGVIMPSLEDLEKMYADSDADEASINDHSYGCNGPPPKRTKENIKVSKSIFNAQAFEIAKTLNQAKNGLESDKTVTGPSNISANPKKLPSVPSMCADRVLLTHNFETPVLTSEQFLNANREIRIPYNNSSVIETNNSLQNTFQNKKNDSQNIIETIVLDDEENSMVTNKILTSNENTLIVNPGSPIVIDDDSNDQSIIELQTEYSSVDINNVVNNEDNVTEVNSVDDVIADNIAVLENYNNTQNLNTVTNVVSDATVSNVNNNTSEVVEEAEVENENLCDDDQVKKWGIEFVKEYIASKNQHPNKNIATRTKKNSNSLCDATIYLIDVPKSMQDIMQKQSSGAEGTQLSLSSLLPQPPQHKFADCPICIDPLTDQPIVATVCGHVFCKRCIVSAMKSSGKKCPTCRKSLKLSKPYYQIFL